MNTKAHKQRRVLKPSTVLRMFKRGALQSKYPESPILCEKCRKTMGGTTSSPTFWSNGSYVYCPYCKLLCLARPVFPTFEIDLTGERKSYPLTKKVRP